MKTWDRFIAAIHRNEIDHVPVALIGTNRFYASINEVELDDLFFDPQKMVDVQIQSLKKLKEITFIPGLWPDFGVGILSAFGCKVVWQKHMMPQINDHILGDVDSFPNLKIPNPHTDGMMVWYLKTLSKFMERKDELEDCSHFVWSFGPGELATYFCGASNFLMHLNDHPLEIQILLEKITDAIIVWLNAQLEINKQADAMLITDDIAGMMSKKFYETFLLPVHQKIRNAFPDFVYVFHNDTKSDHLLASLPAAGINVFNLGKTTDLVKARDTLSAQVSLMGNIDPLDLMMNGKPEEVYQEAVNRLKIFHKKDGFILSVGGGLNDGTKVENIQALLQAVKNNKNGKNSETE